ncbi:anti-sigma factor [Nocardia yunnanensis]|uniref:Regulator of SigK n=1 Tax=Nocardia yunnanensis TaxID=2382165 RepID=A0A386ZED3_9NOCA|nr:anti-sigma factor [Nocardia yunnanensis]AYF75858.1 anti-sigma factor [Nocardia yunnanensis]
MPDLQPDADLLDLAHPYALDALSSTERAAVERRLDDADESTAAAFRSAVRDLRETLAAMTVIDAVPAPPSVEESLQRLLDEQQRPAGERTDPAHATTPRPVARLDRRRALRWTAVAAAAAVAVGLGAGILVHRSHSGATGDLTAQQISTHADTRQHTVPISGGGTLTVDSSPQLRAALVSFDAVPAPPAGHTYQLWLISTAGQASSAGVLTTLPAAGAPMLMRFGDAGQLAVSIEPAGGSPAPTTTPIAGVPLS